MFKRLRKKSIFLVFPAILLTLAVVYAADVPVFQSPTDNPETEVYDGKITSYFWEWRPKEKTYHKGIDVAIGQGAKNGRSAMIVYPYVSGWVVASALQDSSDDSIQPQTER